MNMALLYLIFRPSVLIFLTQNLIYCEYQLNALDGFSDVVNTVSSNYVGIFIHCYK